MTTAVRRYKNRLLASLPERELARLTPHLSPLRLEQEQTLADGKLSHAYFLEEGIALAVVTMEDGHTVEVGVIGFDGVVGLPILFGTGSGPGRTFIQMAGFGYRIRAQILKQEFEQQGELRRVLQRYMQAFLSQSAQTAACNRLHDIEERLARWLLTCRDRTEGDELRLTHNFLGQMLGAPRSTVTLATGLLQRAGLIDYSRGVVIIKKRAELENATCECYGTVRDEFKGLKLL